jgi:GYF domain 2
MIARSPSYIADSHGRYNNGGNTFLCWGHLIVALQDSEVACERIGTNIMNEDAPTTTIVETERYWYYLEDDKQRGPVPENLVGKMLRERVLRPETLIWAEPMTEWIPASEIDVFKVDLCHFPPPAPPVTAPAPAQPGVNRGTASVFSINGNGAIHRTLHATCYCPSSLWPPSASVCSVAYIRLRARYACARILKGACLALSA